MTDIAANWRRVRSAVVAAAIAARRTPESVRILAVSKTKPRDMVEQAIAAGVTDCGENYVQEAAEKIPAVTVPVRWHLIGHLQRNKSARAVELFDCVHSVDSIALGQALARHAAARGKHLSVLLQVNISGERSKSGLDPAEVATVRDALADAEALSIDGLMTVPPAGASAEAARPYFRALRQLRDRLQTDAPANAPLQELSMGMSADFPVAIAEGATIVRIGTAIFGARTHTQKRGE